MPIGVLEAQLMWCWLHSDNIWLPEELRGRGLGSRLLHAAEQYAISHECTSSYLDTFEFQALPFYERHGYEVLGTLEGFPRGFRRHDLRKALAPAAA